MVVINIEVISDVVCVWCYIGSRTLVRGIELYEKTYPGGKNDIFNITWRPYYLNYHPPGQSVDKAELTKIKLAGWSPEKIAAATNRVTQIGQGVGIKFRNGGKVGSTGGAHWLIHLAQIKGKPVEQRDMLVEKLFRAYHEEERDISNPAVLQEIAVDAGLSDAEVKTWLESSVAGNVVDAEAERNREPPNSGVPRFTIQGVHRIDGAQDPQDFLEAFVKVKEAGSEA